MSQKTSPLKLQWQLDVATSFRIMEKCLEFFFKSKKCLKEGSFEFRKWNSNNKELVDKICVEEYEISYEQGKIWLGYRKVLGIKWDIEKDLFGFNFDGIVQLAKDLKFKKEICLKLMQNRLICYNLFHQ